MTLVACDNHVRRILIIAGQQELVRHSQTVRGADIITLGAEAASPHVDLDLLLIRNELDGLGRANLDAQLTADALLFVVGNLAPEARGDLNWWSHDARVLRNLVQESFHGLWGVSGRERVRGRVLEELSK